jgi:hypothetical protein
MASLVEVFLARVIHIDAVQRHRPASLDAATAAFFDTGRRLGVWGDYLWPLDHPEESAAFTLIADGGGSLVLAPGLQSAWDAAVDGFRAFVAELRSGAWSATGMPAGGGPRGPLDPADWAGPGLLLDVRNGDLLEWRDGRRTVRWRAIAVAQGATTNHNKPALGQIDWDDWWQHEVDRRDRNTLPFEKLYLRQAPEMIQDRYGVKSVSEELRRLKVALYRGDLERPKSTKRRKRAKHSKTKSLKRSKR